MDVTNPGLVNVADQSAGNPDTRVGATSVPYQTDALAAPADAGHPAGTDVPADDSVFPTPVDASAGDSQYPSAPQGFGVVPGVAPTFAPFPAPHNEVVVGLQDVPQAGTSEFTVAGPRTSIQTNQNPESERAYTVSSVLDADTGGPVVDPAVPASGTFVAAADQTTKVRFASAAAFPASLVDGVTMGISCPLEPTYNSGGLASGVVNTSGNISGVSDAGGGKITVSSNLYSLTGVLADAVAVLAGTGVPSYDGAHAVSNVKNKIGTFTTIRDLTVWIRMVSPTPTGLSVGDVVTLSGAYGGPHAVNTVTNYLGLFDSVTDAGGGVVTFHVTGGMPTMVAGQSVTLNGAVYAGVYEVSNITANSFDVSPVGGFVGTDSGTFTSYTFSVAVAYGTSYSGTWSCRTFDVTVAYVSDATGTWQVSNFDLPLAYSGTASGAWTFYPTTGTGTTRYRLGLAPADLDTLGVAVQDREIVFDDPTLTAANSGASRLVQFATNGWIVVGKYDEESDVPVLSTPQVGDAFTLYSQREGSELFVEQLGQVVDVTLAGLPPPVAAQPVQAGFPVAPAVNVSTGTQPGQPTLGQGVQVPTAVTVNVAEQATTVGLPANVFV